MLTYDAKTGKILDTNDPPSPAIPVSLLAAWIERAAHYGAGVEPELVTWARANCGETSRLNSDTLEVVARLKGVTL